MNAFRKLLLAPVVLGLAAPVAAQAQSFDMGNVNRYTQQQDTDRMRALEAQMGQVTSVSQFSDVYPTDWAYQALANLVETYGCVAGYPDGTFKGNIALTRYEAAALLNACLDRVTEITEELKRLMKEFEKELVVLKARVDGLEAQTAELAATQFSTTTKLSGVAFFWLGGAVYNDSGKSPAVNSAAGLAEVASYADAIENNGLNLTPGSGINNFATEVAGTSKAGLGRIFQKGATWSGQTGAGAVADVSGYTGDPTTYGDSNLANISVAATLNNAAVAPVTLENIIGGATSGQLAVTGLRGNGDTFGTVGFGTNDLPLGIGLTPGNYKKDAELKGLDKAGVAMGGFTLDSTDLANLIRLGNASRKAKNAPMIGYNNNVVSTSATFNVNDPGYQIADGGYFTNTNVYTDPFNASIAEYGSLGPALANQKYVKNAARKLLKDLFSGDVAVGEAVSFNYDVRLDFNTSFTGKDLLRTRLRSGNFQNNTFAGTPFPVTGAEIAFEEGGTRSFNVNRLFYQFPVGDSWTVTAGPQVRQDDMLAVWPSQYPAETIMDFFTYAGAPGTYSLNLGAGAGLSYAGDILGMDGFAVSANYVAGAGNESFTGSNPVAAPDGALGGIANDNSNGTGTVQIAYTGDVWNLTAAYAYNQGGAYGGYIPVGTPLASDPFAGLSTFSTSSFALSGWFAPEDWGRWMPSVSAGWGVNSYTANADVNIWGINAVGDGDKAESQSWYVGLQWPDIFLQGNYLGTAVGQPTFISSNDSFLESDDSTFAWEIWYKFQVTDNIAVTPAYFFIDNPSGMGEGGNVQGGVLKTTFTF
jgi:hypothetical protein